VVPLVVNVTLEFPENVQVPVGPASSGIVCDPT
jgi:hypothetical protein